MYKQESIVASLAWCSCFKSSSSSDEDAGASAIISHVVYNEQINIIAAVASCNTIAMLSHPHWKRGRFKDHIFSFVTKTRQNEKRHSEKLKSA